MATLNRLQKAAKRRRKGVVGTPSYRGVIPQEELKDLLLEVESPRETESREDRELQEFFLWQTRLEQLHEA